MHRQSGLSLVSLMVGLTLSLLSVAAMMAMYKITVGISVSARQAAELTAQIDTALLVAQKKLQAAGYGLTSPAYGTNLFVLQDAALDGGALTGSAVSIGTVGNATVWEWEDDSTQCDLLLAPSDGVGLLYASVACSAATDWATLDWGTPVTLVDDFGNDNPDVAIEQSIAFTAQEEETCRPFGLTDPGVSGERLALVITVSDTLTPEHALEQKQKVRTCLLNF
ncbi:hypothetical protein Thimo_0810 [Thioflavicoccus mobilis 8321]|uniref:Tfp pilus assembly protein PilW n=1 Tax=Thioflavicoccus mobilis 8321 TaxID=765912 RepID=L0GWH3_9GAMM|nr:hypothetical protein [Thioflavicoccus mobilis]AGA89649.1 hypothetical protein Thimo_0810 [Thioflavicoccus mobilis 8321]